MKARKVVTRSGRKFKGLFPSKKLQRMVEWESLLERDAILLFEFSPGVVSYQEQPEMIEYEQDGVMRRYYPDFRVIHQSGEIIYFEIKPASVLKEPLMVKKYSAIKDQYDRMSQSYQLLLDNRIRVEPRLRNLKRLATAQHRPEDYAILLDEATKLVKSDPRHTCLSLATVFGLSHVMVLIGRGDLCCDLDKDMLADDNYLRIPTEDDRESFLY